MTDSVSTAPAALGAIAVSGADAADFLRAQLSNDVMRLGHDRHFLAAWCDAKGRTQMIARVCERDDGYLLILPEELIDGVMKRLQMFVLRAAVKLRDCRGVLRIDARVGGDIPAANQSSHSDDVIRLGLAPNGEGEPRALEIVSADRPPEPQSISTDDTRWLALDIDAGIPTLTLATQGMFVPQMLNLHWLGAIDFDKGCYPGQEVIARLHYRGTLTRRMFRLFWHGEQPLPGSDVIDADGERAGTVLSAAPNATPDQGALLAVIKTRAIGGSLTSTNATLELGELPYPTPG